MLAFNSYPQSFATSEHEAAAHRNQAEQNEILARQLAGLPVGEIGTSWAVVLLHYAALHFIDAYLISAYGIHSYSHDELAANIRTCRELTPLDTTYHELRCASEAVRYRMRRVGKADFYEIWQENYRIVKRAVLILERTSRLYGYAHLAPLALRKLLQRTK